MKRAKIGRLCRKVVTKVKQPESVLILLADPSAPGEYIQTKRCTKCKQILQLNCFYVKPQRQDVPSDDLTIDDLRSQCIECHDKQISFTRMKNRISDEIEKTISKFMFEDNEKMFSKLQKIMSKENGVAESEITMQCLYRMMTEENFIMVDCKIEPAT